MCIVASAVTALAGKKNETKTPFIGTWKFSNQSALNDFQKVAQNKQDCQTEYFTFNTDHSFTQDFLDAKKNLIKTLKGKWKSNGDKINITYYDIDFNLNTTYFFIDKDLVLGQNFNHIIFTKEDADYNVALK